MGGRMEMDAKIMSNAEVYQVEEKSEYRTRIIAFLKQDIACLAEHLLFFND